MIFELAEHLSKALWKQKERERLQDQRHDFEQETTQNNYDQ